MGDRLGVISAILGILGFPLAIIAMFSREGKAKSHKVTFGLIAAGLIAACVTLLAIKYIPARGMTGAAKPPARPAPSSLDRVLREGRVSVGAEPFAITADDAGVWVANREANSVSQLDPKANRLLHTISVGKNPVAVVADAGSIWVASNSAGTITRIDERSRRPIWVARVGTAPAGIAIALGQVWVTDAIANRVYVLDQASGRVRGSVSVGRDPVSIVYGNEFLWVTSVDDNRVEKLDPRTRRVVAQVDLGKELLQTTFSAGALWLTAPSDNRVLRLDPDSLTVRNRNGIIFPIRSFLGMIVSCRLIGLRSSLLWLPGWGRCCLD